MQLVEATFAADFEVKREPGPPTFEGLASTFGNADMVGDVIEPGAFRKSVGERGASGIRLLWQHDTSQPVGVLKQVRETEDGLFVEGELLDTNLGRDVAEILRKGAVDRMSIGFRSVRDRFDSKKKVRILEEIDLREVSLVTFPANEKAKITSVKAVLADGGLPSQRDVERALHEIGFSRTQAKGLLARGYDGLKSADKQASELVDTMRQLAAAMRRQAD